MKIQLFNEILKDNREKKIPSEKWIRNKEIKSNLWDKKIGK